MSSNTSEIAIKVENLGKKYVINHEKGNGDDNFREVIIGNTKKIITSLNPFSKSVKQESTTEDFWALDDVNFTINKGDKVGIIGRNGAGKSTLLKVLSRITEPTTGKIHINGRIASLLEVGTGFHPELTGRENIYLNGAILGMSRKEIKSKFDEIVAFAEVEKFLDTPVKRYSSGMYVRLAFSVAAHLEPEILVVDEVLAVGDVEFQKKCLGKMGEVSRAGRTILFVSHNMAVISSLCNKSILLENGEINFMGETSKAIQKYMQPNSNYKVSSKLFLGPLRDSVVFEKITLNQKEGSGITINPSDHIEFTLEGKSKKYIENISFDVTVYKDDVQLFKIKDVIEFEALQKGKFILKMAVPPYTLRPGLYTVSVGGREGKYGDWLHGKQLLDFFIEEKWDKINQYDNDGIINIPFNAQREQGL